MGLILTVTAGLVVWIVLWALGAKGFDAFMLATLIIQPARDAWHRLRWSAWRRRHQHRARACHYQRQAREP